MSAYSILSDPYFIALNQYNYKILKMSFSFTMLHKMKLIFIIFFFVVNSSFSQSREITITGIVFLDSIASQDAVVTLLPHSKSVISNDEGIYNFSNIKVADDQEFVELQSSFLGYINNITKLRLSDINSYVLNLYLESDAQELDEIVIVNQKTRIIKTVNKLTYNVRKGDYISNTEGSEVFNSVPNLSYDKSSGVKIDGNRKALVFVDGVETSISELNGIDASQIKSVEVVTNPSAKFGSEFGGGLINVILRKSDSIYYRGAIQIGKGLLRPTTSLNPRLSLKTNNLNINGTYDYSKNEQEVSFGVLRNPLQENFYKQVSLRKPEITQSSSNINFRYTFGEKDFVYFKGAYVLNEEKGEINGEFSNNNIQNVQFSNNSTNSYKQWTFDGVMEKQIRKNLLSIKTRYVIYHKENFFDITNHDEASTSAQTKSNFEELSGLINYQIESPIFLGESSQINFGIKYIDRLFSFSDDDYYLNQKILSSFIDSSLPVTKKISSFFSLYIEGVEYGNNDFKNTNLYFLPTFSTNIEVNKKASIEFSYARRISRPNAYDLNETEILLNPGIAEIGNRNLQPELRDYASVRFGYSLKNDGYLSLRPFYESINDAILQELLETNDILVYSKSNIGNVEKYGISLGYNKTFFKKIRTNLSLGYRKNKFDNTIFRNEGETVYGSLFISSNFIKDKVEVSFFSSWDRSSYTFIAETKQNPFTTLSLRTNLFKDKISTSLTYSDLFGWASNIKTIIEQGDINQITDINSKFSNLTINFSYNFGDSFNSSDRIKTLRNSDVQN